MYSAAVFYNPLNFAKLYALSETLLSVDCLYDPNRRILSDDFAQTDDGFLFCTIKMEEYDIKILSNVLYINFDKDFYINECISRIFSFLLKKHRHHLKETKLHISKSEYIPSEKMKSLNFFGVDISYPQHTVNLTLSGYANEIEKVLVIKTPRNKNKGNVYYVASKATCDENMLKDYSQKSICNLLYILRDSVNEPIIPGVFR